METNIEQWTPETPPMTMEQDDSHYDEDYDDGSLTTITDDPDADGGSFDDIEMSMDSNGSEQAVEMVNDNTIFVAEDSTDFVDPLTLKTVLDTSVIMDNMHHYLDFTDLTVLVRVNKLFNTAFGYRLNKLTVFKVYFEMNDKVKIRLKQKVGSNYTIHYNIKSLNELENQLQFVQNKIILLTIGPSGAKATPSLNKLLDRYCLSLTHATFDSKWYMKNSENFVNLFSNLEYLYIESHFDYQNTSINDASLSSQCFPRLKIIRLHQHGFYSDRLFLKNLVDAAPNLEKILDFPLRCTKILQGSSKIVQTKIKSFSYEESLSFGQEDLDHLTLLSSFDPPMELEHIKLDLRMKSSYNCWVEGCGRLSNLLSSSKNSLKSLQLYPMAETQSLQFPELTNLNTIQFCLHNSSSSIDNKTRFFPEGLDFNRTFPNLTSIKISWFLNRRPFTSFLPESIFEQKDAANIITSFSKVRSLVIVPHFPLNPVTLDDLNKIAVITPNLSTLTIRVGASHLEILRSVWSLWPQLEQLCMEVDVSDNEMFARPFVLDEIITGIPEDKCVILRKSPPQRIQLIQQLQDGPAISTMTYLKGLKIIFRGSLSSDAQVVSPFSSITALYGFQLLEQLQVIIAIENSPTLKDKLTPLLQPIASCITFVPDYWL